MGPEVDLETVVEHPEMVGKPDGVPHVIVGLLSFLVVITAMEIVALYFALGSLAAIAMALLVLPLLIVPLARRSASKRVEEASEETLILSSGVPVEADEASTERVVSTPRYLS